MIGGGGPTEISCDHSSAQEHILAAALRKEGISFECSEFPDSEVAAYSSQISCTMDDTHRFNALVYLRLEGIEKIESLILPPKLQFLTLVFNKSCKSPTIKDLRFTVPNKSHLLRIYYYDRIPYMEDIVMVVLPCDDYESPVDCNALVLAHIPSMRGNLTEALPPHPDEGHDLSYVGNTFRGQLRTLKITGGPNGIVESFDLSTQRLTTLILKQTCQYKSPSERALISLGRVKDLISMKFETLLENPVFPALQYVSHRSLTILCITAHHGIDLKHLTSEIADPHWFRYLYIHVTSKRTDYVSSISEIYPLVDQLEQVWGAGIVGLRGDHESSNSAADLESRLKARVPSNYPHHIGVSEIRNF